jgi:hypothetical protein
MNCGTEYYKKEVTVNQYAFFMRHFIIGKTKIKEYVSQYVSR